MPRVPSKAVRGCIMTTVPDSDGNCFSPESVLDAYAVLSAKRTVEGYITTEAAGMPVPLSGVWIETHGPDVVELWVEWDSSEITAITTGFSAYSIQEDKS